MFHIRPSDTRIQWVSLSSKIALRTLSASLFKSAANGVDRLRWYCGSCRAIVYEDAFHCTDLGTQIKEAVDKFSASEELRTCKKCGTVAKTKLDDS